MKAWSTWLPDLLPQLPGCPIPVVTHELLRASQTFFKVTRAWKATLPLIPITALQGSVTVPFSDAGQELVRVENAWYDGLEIAETTVEVLDASYPDDWSLHTGTPSKIFQITPGQVCLYPLPITASVTGLRLRVSIRPSETALGLDDEMAVRFRDDIASGAKSRLMMYAGQKWTNFDLAGANGAAFDASMGKSAAASARGFGAARVSSRPRWC